MNGGTLQFSAANTTDYSSRLKLEDGKTGTFDTAGQTVTFTNALGVGGSASGALTKTGAGILALNAANAYGGNTTVSVGALKLGVANAIAASPTVTVTSGATIDATTAGMTLGSGQTLIAGRTSSPATDINGNLTTASGSAIKPANNGTIGTMTVAGNLSLSGGTVNIDVGAGSTSDKITVSGTVSIPVATVINVSSATIGTYTIIDGSSTTTIPTASLSVTGNGALLATFDNSTSGTLKLTLSVVSANLVWNGTTAPGNIWNTTGGNTPWLNGASPSAFTDGDQASFDGTAANNSVDIGATVSPATLSVSSASGVTFGGSGSIAGSATLTKTGNGTLTINNSGNTFSGGTLVNAGALALGHATDSLPNSGAVTVGGGTLDIGANSDTVGAVTLTSGSITGSGGILTGSSYAVQSGSISAKLAGAVALTKTTAGTVTMSGGNTYSGGTTISAGTLALGASDVLADAAAVAVDGATAVLSIAGNSDTVGAVTLKNGGSITGSSGTLTGASYAVENGSSSAILGGTGVSLNKSTAGTVTLSGANTYTGGTTVSAAGTLALSGGGSIADSSAVNLSVSGATFDISAISASSETVGSLAGASGSGLTLGGKNLTAGGDNTTTSFAGTIGGSGGSLTKAGTGVLTLSGANTFSGGVTVNGGRVTLNNNTSAGSGTITLGDSGTELQFASSATAVANAITISDTGTTKTLRYFATSATSSGNVDIQETSSGNFQVVVGAAATLTLSGNINGSGGAGLKKVNPGTLILTGNNAYTGDTLITGGTLALSGSGAISSPTIIVTNGATFDVSAVAGGSYSLNGSGTLAIAISNNVTTGTTQGQVAAGANNFAYAGSLTVVSNANSDAFASGNTFTLFTTSGTRSGWFSSVTLPPLATGLTWDTNHLATAGILDVYTFSTTPLELSTPASTAATISVTKLANHASSTKAASPYPTGWTASVTTGPSHGSAGFSAGALTYTPTTGYIGSDSFAVTFSDGHGIQTMAVSVTVGTSSTGGQSPNVLISGIAGGNFYALFVGMPNTAYTVETNAAASGPTWVKYANYTTGNDGLINVTNVPPVTGSLFFRTVYPSY
jgi:autotransporter-associated beta strand protein